MIEWTDPRILVAICTGGIGVLCGIGSVGFSIFVFAKHRSQGRRQAAWEEYRETIYDPLVSSLKGIEVFAVKCRRMRERPDERDLAECLSRLSELLNEVDIACSKAGGHEASIQADWEDFTDRMNEGIHSLIAERNFFENGGEYIAESLVELENGLRNYIESFEDRLREQRKAMLEF